MDGVGHRVADLHLAGGFHIGNHVTDIASDENIASRHLRRENSNFLDFVGIGGGKQLDPLTAFHRTGKDPHVGDDSAIGVIQGIENSGPQELVRILYGCRHPGDNGFKNLLDADSRLGGSRDALLGRDAQDFLKLLLALRHVGGRKVDLVKHRDDLEILLLRKVEIRHRLGLDALCRVHHQNRTLTRGKSAGDLVGEVDVAGGIEEVELVGFAILRLVAHGDRMGLDRDPLFALQIHGIELLRRALPHRNGAGGLHQTIRERSLAVIDMRDDREISGQLGGHEWEQEFKRHLPRIATANRTGRMDDREQAGSHQKITQARLRNSLRFFPHLKCQIRHGPDHADPMSQAGTPAYKGLKQVPLRICDRIVEWHGDDSPSESHVTVS